MTINNYQSLVFVILHHRIPSIKINIFFSIWTTFDLFSHLSSRQFVLMHFCEWFLSFSFKTTECTFSHNHFLPPGKMNGISIWSIFLTFCLYCWQSISWKEIWQHKNIPASAGPTYGKYLKPVKAWRL